MRAARSAADPLSCSPRDQRGLQSALVTSSTRAVAPRPPPAVLPRMSTQRQNGKDHGKTMASPKSRRGQWPSMAPDLDVCTPSGTNWARTDRVTRAPRPIVRPLAQQCRQWSLEAGPLTTPDLTPARLLPLRDGCSCGVLPQLVSRDAPSGKGSPGMTDPVRLMNSISGYAEWG